MSFVVIDERPERDNARSRTACHSASSGWTSARAFTRPSVPPQVSDPCFSLRLEAGSAFAEPPSTSVDSGQHRGVRPLASWQDHERKLLKRSYSMDGPSKPCKKREELTLDAAACRI